MSNTNNDDHAMIVANDTTDIVSGDMDGAQVNPLVQIHAMLRGRYWLAIVLAIIGLGVGIPAGYRLQPPTYKSTAVIQFKPSLPRILYQTDQNNIMPMFDAYIESQVALIHGEDVINSAQRQPEWVALNRATLEENIRFNDNLTVEHPKGSELIFVSFTDRDSDAARKAVQSVTTAYQEKYGNADSSIEATLIQLQALITHELAPKQQAAAEALSQVAGPLGVAGVKQMYDLKLQQLEQLESQLQDAKVALALAAKPTSRPTQPAASLEVLALRVPEIGRLFSTKRELEGQIAVDRVRLGPQHRTVLDEKAKLDVLSAQLNDTVIAYQNLTTDSSAVSSLVPGSKSVKQLEDSLANVQKLYEEAHKATADYGTQWNKIERAQANVDDLKKKISDATDRYDELNTEKNVTGRMTPYPASSPLAPEKDKRIAFSAVGGLGLGGLGVGFVLILGFLDQRVRHISDVPVTRRCPRILGVLPLLPDKDADPEQAMIAAHSVHQMRMLLQHSLGNEKPVFAVTSASPGAGKTSLTLALGLSFAASGARTLIIDCDIVGGGMTAKMKKVTRRRLGHILRRIGLINTQQLIAALKESKRARELLGQTLIRQGLVTTSDIDRALDVQRDAIVGLREALQGDPANECITSSGSPGLSLMPLGGAQRHHAAQLSYPAFRRVIDQVRAWFDVILIDTGPILGSLEASVAAMAADAVVMTVARGEQRPLVERAMDQVVAAGGTIAGVVMNRAGATDIASSGFSSSTRYLADGSAARSSMRLVTPEHDGLRLGPVGSAVMATGEESYDSAATVTS